MEGSEDGSPLFKNVQFCLADDIGDDEKLECVQILLQNGGTQIKYMSDMVTHFIADNPESAAATEALELFEKPVVTSRWVHLSKKCGTLLPVEAFDLHKNRLFANKVICPSQMSEADTKAVWAMVTFYGGKFQLHLDNTCSHLIAAKPEGDKYERAVQTANRIKIVTPDWVVDSVKNKMICDEELYHPRLLILPKAPSPPKPPPEPPAPPPVSTPAIPVSSPVRQPLPTPLLPPPSPLPSVEQMGAPRFAPRMVSLPNSDIRLSLAGQGGFNIMAISRQGMLQSPGVRPEGMRPVMQMQFMQQQQKQQFLQQLQQQQQLQQHLQQQRMPFPRMAIAVSQAHGMPQNQATTAQVVVPQSPTAVSQGQLVPSQGQVMISQGHVVSQTQAGVPPTQVVMAPSHIVVSQCQAAGLQNQALVSQNQVTVSQGQVGFQGQVGSTQMHPAASPRHQIVVSQGQAAGLQSRATPIQSEIGIPRSQTITSQSQSVVSQGQSINSQGQVIATQGQGTVSQPTSSVMHNQIIMSQTQAAAPQNHSGTSQHQVLVAQNQLVTSQGQAVSQQQPMLQSQAPQPGQAAASPVLLQQQRPQWMPRPGVPLTPQQQILLLRQRQIQQQMRHLTPQQQQIVVQGMQRCVQPRQAGAQQFQQMVHNQSPMLPQQVAQQLRHPQQIVVQQMHRQVQQFQQSGVQGAAQQVTSPAQVVMKPPPQYPYTERAVQGVVHRVPFQTPQPPPQQQQQPPQAQGPPVVQWQNFQQQRKTPENVPVGQQVQWRAAQGNPVAADDQKQVKPAPVPHIPQQQQNVLPQVVQASRPELSPQQNVLWQQQQVQKVPPAAQGENASTPQQIQWQQMRHIELQRRQQQLLQHHQQHLIQQQQQQQQQLQQQQQPEQQQPQTPYIVQRPPPPQYPGIVQVSRDQAPGVVTRPPPSATAPPATQFPQPPAVPARSQTPQTAYVAQQQQQQQQMVAPANSVVGALQANPTQVTPKTKTALANLLNTRLQGVGRIPDMGEPAVVRLPVPVADGQHVHIREPGIANLPLRPPIRGPTPVPRQAPDEGRTFGTEVPVNANAPVEVHFYGHDPRTQVPMDMCLMGCVFCILDYDKAFEESKIAVWKKVIEQKGGEIEDSYCARCTHVVCETQQSPVAQQAVREGKRCVTVYWLNDVLLKKKLQPPFLALHFPLPFAEEKPCKNQIISASGFEGEERIRVKQMILATGAKYTCYLTRLNSLLITKKREGMKFQKAQEWNITTVNVQWLQDIMLGHYEALRLPMAQKYQRYEAGDNSFRPDYSLVPHLMAAWRVPVKLTEEMWKRFTTSDAFREAQKRKLQASNKPGTPPKQRRSTLTLEENVPLTTTAPPPEEKMPYVLFTGMKDVELMKIVLQLGGAIAKTPKECTHLVTKKVQRTIKFLCAINVAKFVLTPQWLQDSAVHNTFLDEDPYIVEDTEAEKTFGFSLKQVLQRTNRAPIFKGMVFFITPGVYPSPPLLKDIVESAGGTVCLKKRPSLKQITSVTQGGSKFVIVSCDKDMYICQEYTAKNINVYNAEFILTGVLRQCAEFDSYLLS